MRHGILATLTAGLVLGTCGCQEESEQATAANADEQRESDVFLNIDIPAMKAGLHHHFDDIRSDGSQAKSVPGTAGYLAMKGHRFQRFQIAGTISDTNRTALTAQLKADLQSVLKENGATIVSGISDSVRDRPIWLLSLVVPSATRIDAEHMEGFYFEYSSDSGGGFVDFLACKAVDGDDPSNLWRTGLAIHELQAESTDTQVTR